MTLKQKVIHGTKWLILEKILNSVISLGFSIFLARLLSPSEFGIVAISMVLVSFLSVIVSSGLSSSLIRSKSVDNHDFNTIFYFNLFISLISYALLFLTAPIIADFYDLPILTIIIQLLGIVLLISGLTNVQESIIIRRMDFKFQSKVKILSLVISGFIGLFLAFNDFGVWSIVCQSLSFALLKSIIYWYKSKWKPKFDFSWEVLVRHLSFGLHYLRSQVTISLTNNLFFFIVGKYFSPATLGYYNRADSLLSLFSKNIEQTTNSIIYPTLSKLNDDKPRMTQVFNEFLMMTIFISSFLTLNFVAISTNFIHVVFGSKWIFSADIIKILSVSAVFYPLNIINIRVANVLGDSKKFANAILFQQLLWIILAVLGSYMSFNFMLYGTIVVALLTFVYNSNVVSNLTGLSIKSQMKSIIVNSSPAVLGSSMVYCLSIFLGFGYLLNLCIQIVFGGLIYLFYFEIIRPEIYLKSKQFLISMIKK